MNGTSGDVFSEYLVKCRMTAKNYALIAGSIFAAALLTMTLILFIPSMSGFAILLWMGVYYVVKFQKTEYEYTFTSGDLDIDQLSGEMRRKRKLELTSDTIELIAPEKSDALDSYSHGQYKIYDYSSHDSESKNRYVIVAKIRSEAVKVIFEPNEKMLDNMWRYSPSKVKRA